VAIDGKRNANFAVVIHEHDDDIKTSDTTFANITSLATKLIAKRKRANAQKLALPCTLAVSRKQQISSN